MSNTGFTIGYNYILRDQSLSLATKGLYLVVSSYIGMPEWKLTKDVLIKICGTAYAVKRHGKNCLQQAISESTILLVQLPAHLVMSS